MTHDNEITSYVIFVRWRSSLSYVRTASHVLSAYRSQLYSLTEDKWDIMSQIYQRSGEDFISDMTSKAM
ncbi:hypothetical protein R6Q57_005298 [Mikania cordata]